MIFVDTAGLRDARDEIEVEGIRRSRITFERADLILHVLDASEPLMTQGEHYLAEFAGKKRILVMNKVDLPQKLQEGPIKSDAVKVSCVTGAGIEQLKDAIKSAVWSGDIKAEMLEVMINSRHQDALRRAAESVRRSLDGLQADLSLELIAMDLHIAVNALGEIVGKTTTEDLLDSIFSQFCIGK